MTKVIFLLFLPLYLLATPFKVASYNVENLFDLKVQGTEYQEYIPGKHNWNSSTLSQKLNNISEVICDLDADILGLQEIENENIFMQLRKNLTQVGCGYPYGAITHKRGSSIQVAILSRFPIVHKKEIIVSKSPRVRNILEVELRVKGKPLTIFVNHWKAKSRGGYESKRIEYAKALKKELDSFSKTKEYIILGDLNSNYNAHLTLKKRVDDSSGKTGIGDVLKTVKDNNLLDTHMVHRLGKGWHYNLWQELAYSDRWSHKFYGNKSTLDNILLPSILFDGDNIDYVPNSFSVFKPSYLFNKKGYIYRWEITKGRHMGRGYSDHLAIYAYFDTKAYVFTQKTFANNSKEGSIEELYQNKSIDRPIVLKNAAVVLKRGRYAVIKQKPQGRGIFVYASVDGLKEGHSYDFRVEEIKSYKGLKEITSLVKLKELGPVKLDEYYQKLNIKRENEVVRDLTGIYKKGYLYTDGKRIPLYFKNKKIRVRSGSKIKIYYGHIGYYKRLQLVIYSKKDFEILGR